jgi:hypothetical protein
LTHAGTDASGTTGDEGCFVSAVGKKAQALAAKYRTEFVKP